MGEIESLLLYAFSVMLLFGLVGLMIGQRKGRAAAGFVFGALTGPIGWLVVFLGPDHSDTAKKKRCLYCAETINEAAIVCKHCGGDQQAQSGHQLRRSKVSSTGDDFEDWLRDQKEHGRMK